MTSSPSIFADTLQGATIQNNVVRLQLCEIGADGAPAPCGQLLIPLNSFGVFAANVAALVKQMEERLREAQGANGNGAASVPPAAS